MAIVPVGRAAGMLAGDGIGQTGQAASGQGTFSKVIDRLLGDANGQQIQADKAVEDLALGRTDNLHGVMLAVAKADLSFRLALEVRNRLTEAFQEMMRMQV
jgi:flagellar hook-basal body complex protein FliE